MTLEARKDSADFLGTSELGYSIGDGIVVLQTQQRRELIPAQFFHSDVDVVRQHKIDKLLLLVIDLRTNAAFGLDGASARVNGGKA